MINNMPKQIDPEVRRITCSLLASGMLRPSEAAEHAGVSLQVVNYWARSAGIDWQRMRRARVAKAYRRQASAARSRGARQG